jgi:phosphatidylserine synthase
VPAADRSSTTEHALAYVLTGCNLACGIAALLLPGDGRPVRRSTLILLGAACDTFDGTLARRSGWTTDFGARADGISDFVCCAMAPAALVASGGSEHRTRLERIAPGLFVAAAAWRVAKYGIGTRTSHVFRGIPVTGAGILLAAGCEMRLPRRTLPYLALALTAAMLSPVRVLSGEALARRALRAVGRNG